MTVAVLVAPFVACVLAVGPLFVLLDPPVDFMTTVVFVGIYTLWGTPAALAFGFVGLKLAGRLMRADRLSVLVSMAAGALSAGAYVVCCLALTKVPGLVVSFLAPWVGFAAAFPQAGMDALAPATVSVASILLGGAAAGWTHSQMLRASAP